MNVYTLGLKQELQSYTTYFAYRSIYKLRGLVSNYH